MTRHGVAVFVLVVLASGMLSSSAGAQTVNTFTSLPSWQAAVASSWLFSQNFQSFTKDTYFQTVPLNVGPFSLEQVGEDAVIGFFQNFIDVPPLQFSDNSGVTNAALYTKFGVQTVDLTFAAPVFAWGANFYGAQSGELVNIVLTATEGGVIATVPVTVDTGFFGFVISPSEGVSKITFTSHIDNPIASVGQGFGLENVTGAYTSVPTLVAATQIATIASGLAYSRVSQTFNGTVTIKNISSGSISGPFQIVFANLPAGVTLVSAVGTQNGNPYITIPVASLAPGQSSTVNVQFSDPSNATIKASPAIYSGSFN
jgi:hypothetical protein